MFSDNGKSRRRLAAAAIATGVLTGCIVAGDRTDAGRLVAGDGTSTGTGSSVAGDRTGVGRTVAGDRTSSGSSVAGDGTGAVGRAPYSAGRPHQSGAVTDDGLLHRASERLIARCMARHGFAYAEQPPPTAEPDFRHVIDDVGWARRHGYGPLLGRPGTRAQDANTAILGRLTPERRRAWQRTLLGSGRHLHANLPGLGRVSAPGNGCTAEARRVLYGDLAGWYRARRVADHLGSYVGRRVIDASEYRTGLARWARCARGRGYAVSSPYELRDLVARQTPAEGIPRQAPAGEAAGQAPTRETTGQARARESAGRAPAREVAAAVTEAECAVSSGLSTTIDALERRFRPEIERRFARRLDALKLFEREAIPRARQTLATTTTIWKGHFS